MDTTAQNSAPQNNAVPVVPLNPQPEVIRVSEPPQKVIPVDPKLHSADGHPPINGNANPSPEVVTDHSFKEEPGLAAQAVNSEELKELENIKKRVERVKIQVVDALGAIPNIEDTIKSMRENAKPDQKQSIELLLTLVHVLVILKHDSKSS